ncbi:transglycosylase SLT domain-containing protein [Morganella morganii]
MIVEQMKFKLAVETGGFLDATRKIKNETEDMKTKVKRNTGEVTKGFGELNLGIQKFSTEGKNAFTSVMSGAAKFLGVAVTLEGARRAFVSTTDSLITLGTQAAWLGMNAKHLDAFNRAAESVGSSREAVGSALGRMNEWDIWSKTNVGPAPAYIHEIMRLQGESAVNIMNGKDAEEKTLRAFEAIRSLKDESRAQQLYTTALGLSDPALFRSIRNGKFQAAFEEYKDKSSYTEQAERQAEQVRKIMTDLNVEVKALNDALYLNFGDKVVENLKKLTTWINENRDGIIGFFREFRDVATELIDALGGMSGTLAILIAYKMGGLPAAAAVAYGIAAEKSDKNDQPTNLESRLTGSGMSSPAVAKSSPGLFLHPLMRGSERVPIRPEQDALYMKMYSAEERKLMDETARYSREEQLKNIQDYEQHWYTVSWLNVDKAAKENKEAKEAEHRRQLLFGTGSDKPVKSNPASGAKRPAGERKPPSASLGVDIYPGELPQGVQKPSGVVRGKEKYGYIMDEYTDKNGNIINPVKTDKGFASMDRILDAVTQGESGWKHDAKNGKSTATGLFQLTDATARGIGLSIDGGNDERLDPEKARAKVAIYWARLLKKYNGNVFDARMAYGMGEHGFDQFIAGKRNIGEEAYNGAVDMTNYYAGMNRAGSMTEQRINQMGGVQQPTNQFYVNNMEIKSQPESVDALSNSIQEQASRAGMNVSFDTMGR